MAKFARSVLVAQGFAGWDPGRGHSIAHQAMWRWHPTIAEPERPTTRMYNCVLGVFGEEKEKKKEKNPCPHPSYGRGSAAHKKRAHTLCCGTQNALQHPEGGRAGR